MKTKLSVISGVALMVIGLGVNAQELTLSDAQMDGVTAGGVSAWANGGGNAFSGLFGTSTSFVAASATAGQQWGWFGGEQAHADGISLQTASGVFAYSSGGFSSGAETW